MYVSTTISFIAVFFFSNWMFTFLWFSKWYKIPFSAVAWFSKNKIEDIEKKNCVSPCRHKIKCYTLQVYFESFVFFKCMENLNSYGQTIQSLKEKPLLKSFYADMLVICYKGKIILVDALRRYINISIMLDNYFPN